MISRLPTLTDRARLRGLVTVDGDRDVDVEHLARLGVRQVLAGRPHQRPSARALQRRDRGGQPAPAEQERTARAQMAARSAGSTGTGCGSAPARGMPASPCGSHVTGRCAGTSLPRHDRHALAGRRLLARRRLPTPRAQPARGARRDARGDRRQRPERLLARPSSSRPWPPPTAPTCRCRSAACRSASRSSTRSRDGPTRTPRCCTATHVAAAHEHACRPHPGARRRRARRSDDGVGVRRRELHAHRAQRRDPQPVAARAHARVVRPVARRRRSPAGWSRSPRRRRRWLDPDPGRLHRPARLEGDLRPDPADAQRRARAR